MTKLLDTPIKNPSLADRALEMCKKAEPGPQGYDDILCAVCNTQVSVNIDYQWDDGDICNSCAFEFLDQFLGVVPELAKRINAACALLREIESAHPGVQHAINSVYHMLEAPMEGE